MTEAQRQPDQLLLADDYADDHRPGTVIGSRTQAGQPRGGVDVESVLSIDHDALRFQPLIQAGWGRSGVSYGPFARENGLALSVFMLNGHNTSNIEPFTDSLPKRVWRWLLGTTSEYESKRVVARRLLRWLLSDHPQRFPRKLRWWRHLRTNPPLIDENLAIGWFAQEQLSSSLPTGNAFIMHGIGSGNGELWAEVGGVPLTAISGVQNIPIAYVIVLREQGAAYYAASLPNAFGLSAAPQLRPLAIDPSRSDSPVFAGIYQSVLGQIGFRVDSRVYATRIAALGGAYAQWYGTAHAADALISTRLLAESESEIGGRWQILSGLLEGTPQGAVGKAAINRAILTPAEPSGLIHFVVETGSAFAGSVSALFRVADDDNVLRLQFSGAGVQLSYLSQGSAVILAASERDGLAPNAVHAIQILDDGSELALYLDGHLLFNHRVAETRLATASGVGFELAGAGVFLRNFEAHPRTVTLPAALAASLFWNRAGEQVVAAEQFAGDARPLDGKTTSSGALQWQRTLGVGRFDLTGEQSAKVRASADQPNPGRTAYTIAWQSVDFADLGVDIGLPGIERGQGDGSRAGLIFYQDDDNYIVVSVYVSDLYAGNSVSSFFMLNGFEDVYDAVWTNVDRHIAWGTTFRLEVAFDGAQYLVHLNHEPVLYRALTDVYPSCQSLRINRVGVVANWEWGDDTGSILRNFVAKG